MVVVSTNALGAIVIAATVLVGAAGVASADDVVHPVDKPISVNTKQMEALQRAVRPYVEKARATYPEARGRFLSGLPRGQVFFVTAPLHDRNGITEQAFVRVTGIKDGRIYGRIASNISLVKELHNGDTYDLSEADLVDWTISKSDGSEEGNYVGKFLDTYQPE